MKITALEFKELLIVLLYYLLGGLVLGIVIAPIAVGGGIVFVRSDDGLPLAPREITALVVVFLGVLAALMGYIILLPAELKIIRRRLRLVILKKRLLGKR